MTLRHRRADDGSEDGWTLKLPEPSSSAGTVRREIGAPGSADQPPIRLRDLVTSMTLGDELAPVAVIRTDRRLSRLDADGGGPLVEIADDRVESTVDGLCGPSFRQIEVELVDPGATKRWKRVIGDLRDAGLGPSTEGSKLQRVLGAPPDRTHDRQVRKHASVPAFVSAVIGSTVDQLVMRDPWVRLGEDPEAIHKARVATRRLRADLKTYRPLLDEQTVDSRRDDLKWIGSLLGEVRDSHVLLDAVEEDARDLHGSADELVGHLDHFGVSARGALLNGMQSDRYVNLLRALCDLADDPPLRTPGASEQHARPLARTLADRQWKRARRTKAKLDRNPSDEELHTLRKAVKQARYAAESTRPIGVGSKAFIQSARRLQDQLGELHDCVVEIDWLRSHSDEVTTQGAYVAGQIDAVATDRRRVLRSSWKDRWDATAAVAS